LRRSRLQVEGPGASTIESVKITSTSHVRQASAR
jgi:hypothetical protein